MADEFSLKNHVKVYYKANLYDPTWTVFDNYNVVSIDIDRYVQDTGGFMFVNTPGVARITMRRNKALGAAIDEDFATSGPVDSKYYAIKVVATIYPDTNPTDINIFWGVITRSQTNYQASKPDNDVSKYEITFECKDMLYVANNAAAPSSFLAEYPENRFINITSYAHPIVNPQVQYSGVTIFPAETDNRYQAGDLLQELQESDLAFVACDYYNEQVSFYGRYYLPQILSDIGTKESSGSTVGFSTNHSTNLNHFCIRELSLSKDNEAYDSGYYRFVKKSDPTVYYFPTAGGSIYSSGSGQILNINCSTYSELVDLGNNVIDSIDRNVLDNVSASVIHPSTKELIPELVAMQPVIDKARIYFQRDGETINRAYLVTKLHHRIDADIWTIDVGGCRYTATTIPDPGVLE